MIYPLMPFDICQTILTYFHLVESFLKFLFLQYISLYFQGGNSFSSYPGKISPRLDLQIENFTFLNLEVFREPFMYGNILSVFLKNKNCASLLIFNLTHQFSISFECSINPCTGDFYLSRNFQVNLIDLMTFRNRLFFNEKKFMEFRICLTEGDHLNPVFAFSYERCGYQPSTGQS